VNEQEFSKYDNIRGMLKQARPIIKIQGPDDDMEARVDKIQEDDELFIPHPQVNTSPPVKQSPTQSPNETEKVLTKGIVMPLKPTR